MKGLTSANIETQHTSEALTQAKIPQCADKHNDEVLSQVAFYNIVLLKYYTAYCLAFWEERERERGEWKKEGNRETLIGRFAKVVA